MIGNWVCRYCGHRLEGEDRGKAYWHIILCDKNPTRVLSWDGWMIGETGKLPNKKGK